MSPRLSAVCHEVPEEPVVSPVSGRVFERRLLAKWVQDNGTDPVNGEPLSGDQLITINGILGFFKFILRWGVMSV